MRIGRPPVPFEDQYEVVTESGCWIWMGGLNLEGYGQMAYSRKAHRVSYERRFGPIPPWLSVCHRCDVRACVNPAHLFLGTAADNTQDAVRKGRHVHGGRSHKSKMTEADVAQILASHLPCFVLAERYGVRDTSISNIRLGRTWKHVPRPHGYVYTPYRAPGDHRRYGETSR